MRPAVLLLCAGCGLSPYGLGSDYRADAADAATPVDEPPPPPIVEPDAGRDAYMAPEHADAPETMPEAEPPTDVAHEAAPGDACATVAWAVFGDGSGCDAGTLYWCGGDVPPLPPNTCPPPGCVKAPTSNAYACCP